MCIRDRYNVHAHTYMLPHVNSIVPQMLKDEICRKTTGFLVFVESTQSQNITHKILFELLARLTFLLRSRNALSEEWKMSTRAILRNKLF